MGTEERRNIGLTSEKGIMQPLRSTRTRTDSLRSSTLSSVVRDTRAVNMTTKIETELKLKSPTKDFASALDVMIMVTLGIGFRTSSRVGMCACVSVGTSASETSTFPVTVTVDVVSFMITEGLVALGGDNFSIFFRVSL